MSYQFGTEQGESTALSKEFSHSAHNSFALGFGIGAFGLNFGVSGKVRHRSSWTPWLVDVRALSVTRRPCLLPILHPSADHAAHPVRWFRQRFSRDVTVPQAAEHSVSIHRDAFYKTSSTTYTDTFGAGTVWQFQFRAATPCGNATIRGNHFLVTPSSSQPPCCLPGMALNLSQPHGPCRPSADGTVVDLCKRTTQ